MTCENELKKRFWTNKFEHGSRFNPGLPITALQTTGPSLPDMRSKTLIVSLNVLILRTATMQKYNLFLAVSSDFSLSVFNEYWFICHLTFQQARPRSTCAKLLVWFSELGLNWPAGPLLDQSFWQWNRLFSRAFAEKPSPSCALFRILPIWLESFDKINS